MLELRDPWKPPNYVKADVAAIQAVFRGEATSDQQVRAMEYIVRRISNRNGMRFYPGPEGALAMAMGEGRRFVGNVLHDFTKLNLSKIKDDPK